ncbi:hypothetical protein KL86PLE_41364 [uncultured Pleomorphomonas sp.]|uniref:Uncharacterized protein n=1 Tax=uncultured Pleomorphomonas sp. TaxID=442121 RepID=A0A212LJL3_9HYPH|nr:hypothetical protein KL86PLE_41364 [uncultured Pleomorphomonas sp.]
MSEVGRRNADEDSATDGGGVVAQAARASAIAQVARPRTQILEGRLRGAWDGPEIGVGLFARLSKVHLMCMARCHGVFFTGRMVLSF